MLPVVTFETVITVQKKYNLVSNSYFYSINYACVENLNIILNYIKIFKSTNKKLQQNAWFNVIWITFSLFVYKFSFKKRPPCQITNIIGIIKNYLPREGSTCRFSYLNYGGVIAISLVPWMFKTILLLRGAETGRQKFKFSLSHDSEYECAL